MALGTARRPNKSLNNIKRSTLFVRSLHHHPKLVEFCLLPNLERTRFHFSFLIFRLFSSRSLASACSIFISPQALRVCLIIYNGNVRSSFISWLISMFVLVNISERKTISALCRLFLIKNYSFLVKTTLDGTETTRENVLKHT